MFSLSVAPSLVWQDIGGEFGADGFIQLGFEATARLTPRWAVSLAAARFPAGYTPIDHVHLGARYHLNDRPFSPYLAADVGQEWERVEGQETRHSPFATVGVGFEWVFHRAFLLASDLQTGPQYKDPGGKDRHWELMARYRLLFGIRF